MPLTRYIVMVMMMIMIVMMMMMIIMIRNLIAYIQNLDCDNNESDSDSDSYDGGYNSHDKRGFSGYNSGRSEEEPRSGEQYRSRDIRDSYHDEDQYDEQRQGRQNTKSVIFGSNTINKRIHEEFRQKAKRNESFKIALGSPKLHRRGSMADSLRRSMEDVHDGFVSLSGRTSRSGSVRSRSGSVSSLRSLERSQTVVVQARRHIKERVKKSIL